MNIEILKDVKDPRPNRGKVLRKGTKTTMTKEFCDVLIGSKSAREVVKSVRQYSAEVEESKVKSN